MVQFHEHSFGLRVRYHSGHGFRFLYDPGQSFRNVGPLLVRQFGIRRRHVQHCDYGVSRHCGQPGTVASTSIGWEEPDRPWAPSSFPHKSLLHQTCGRERML